MRIGVISDTHGLLRPQALDALSGCERILHAGDVGRPEILAALGSIAPVTAVRGNVDEGLWADDLPLIARVEVGRWRVLLIHDLKALAQSDCDLVISGHSHRPLIERRGGVLFVNPGSAGPRRFRLPVTLARLDLDDERIDWELVTLLA